jgi:cytochrome P450
MGVETIAISDPEGVRHVLTANARNYRRPYSVARTARPLVGSGLFLAEGADWRRQRRLLAPTFTPATIGMLLPHFRDAGLHLQRSIELSPRAILSKAFQDTALEAVLRALFSLPESSGREQLRDMVRDYIEGTGRPTLIDGFARSEDTFSFANAKRARFQKSWRAAIDQVISRRKASPTAPAHRDLLDLLSSVRDAETGEALSDGEIRDQCATMFFAGSETTARRCSGPATFWRWTLKNRSASARR